MRLPKKRCACLSAGLYSIPTHIGCFGRVGLFLLHVSVCKLAFGQPTGNLYERLIILSAVAAPCLHPMLDPTIRVSVFFLYAQVGDGARRFEHAVSRTPTPFVGYLSELVCV